MVLDPLTGEPVYPINEALPSFRVMPGASMGDGATVCVELLRGGKAGSASRWTGAEELACYRVAKGEVAVVCPFEAPRDLKPGDLIVARRMGGTDAVDVYLHGVHSRVV